MTLQMKMLSYGLQPKKGNMELCAIRGKYVAINLIFRWYEGDLPVGLQELAAHCSAKNGLNTRRVWQKCQYSPKGKLAAGSP